MGKCVRSIAFVVVVCVVLAACQKQGGNEVAEQGKAWDYTVVAVRDCPEDFLAEIEAKKMNPFQMSYMDGEYLYIAQGYGEQPTGGYSIAVNGFYEQGEALCLDTELKGPGKDESVKQKASYPYIIIKTEKTEREVNFKK